MHHLTENLPRKCTRIPYEQIRVLQHRFTTYVRLDLLISNYNNGHIYIDDLLQELGHRHDELSSWDLQDGSDCKTNLLKAGR